MLISITIILRFNSFHTSSCFFGTSKLVSPQFLLFTLFCFREKNGEKTLQLTSINLQMNLNVYMRLLDLRRIAQITMACCTREANFEVVQPHYIQIYPANFLCCAKFPPLTYVKIQVKKC